MTWIEDRLEHLASSAAATGRTTEVEAGFTADGRLLALRYDAIEDVGAYVRAPEPATLYRMHGSLSGAYTVPNVAVRNRVVLTNTQPSGLNRGFGGPQLYFGLERTMAIAARRLGLDPAELARRNLIPADAMPYRTPSGALYDSGRLRRVPRPRARARGLRRAPRPGRGGARRGTARRDRARVHRRAVDLEHGLHHARPDRRRARAHAAEVGQRRRRLDLDRPARRASPCGSRRRRRARDTERSAPRSSPTCSAARPDDVTVLSEMDTASVPWTRRLGQLLVPLLRRRGRCRAGCRAEAPGEDRRDPRPRRRRQPLAAPRRRDGALESRRAARRARSRVSRRLPSGRRRRSILPTTRIASPRRHPTASSSTSARSRWSARRARCACSTTSPSTMPAASSIRCSPTGRCMGGFAHGLAAALYERHVYDEWGNLMTASLVDYLDPDRARHPRADDRPSLVTVARDRARSEGDRRGEHDERPRLHRERGRRRDRAGRRRAAAARRRASGSSSERAGARREARGLRVRRCPLGRGGARGARARRGREADRGRAEPRPAAQHAPRAPDAARRPQPGRARHDRGERRPPRRRHRAPGERSSATRAPTRCCARPCRSSATSSPATAARSAAASPTRTARPRSRSASRRSAGRSSSRDRPGAGRSTRTRSSSRTS